MAFADRTKQYVPVSVPIAHRNDTNEHRLEDLVDPDAVMDDPSPFVGIHACDGLALQQNMETAHLTFKTVSIDEKLSEYLAPLVQLHGDKEMDRICEGSGRGLTQFSEDVRDAGENIQILSQFVGGNVWSRMHNRNGQRRIIRGDRFNQSARWTRSTVSQADQEGEDDALADLARYRDQYDRAIRYIVDPVHIQPCITYTE